jgi:hypothetical protein
MDAVRIFANVLDVVDSNVDFVLPAKPRFKFCTTCNTEPAGKPAVEALLSNVPELSGKLSVRSVLLLGDAMVNVPVPEGFPDNDTRLMVVFLPAKLIERQVLQLGRSKR